MRWYRKAQAQRTQVQEPSKKAPLAVPAFLAEFQARTKGIYAQGKWLIWGIDETGYPSHGQIEKLVNSGQIPDIQAEVGRDGLSGFLRVRREMQFRDAASAFSGAIMADPDVFELEIELPSGKYSTGTISEWLG